MTIKGEIRSFDIWVHSIKISTPVGSLLFKGKLFLNILRNVLGSDSKFENVLVRNMLVEHQRISVPGA